MHSQGNSKKRCPCSWQFPDTQDSARRFQVWTSFGVAERRSALALRPWSPLDPVRDRNPIEPRSRKCPTTPDLSTLTETATNDQTRQARQQPRNRPPTVELSQYRVSSTYGVTRHLVAPRGLGHAIGFLLANTYQGDTCEELGSWVGALLNGASRPQGSGSELQSSSWIDCTQPHQSSGWRSAISGWCPGFAPAPRSLDTVWSGPLDPPVLGLVPLGKIQCSETEEKTATASQWRSERRGPWPSPSIPKEPGGA